MYPQFVYRPCLLFYSKCIVLSSILLGLHNGLKNEDLIFQLIFYEELYILYCLLYGIVTYNT